ncbi:MAG: HD domain-containing phosphohydrolase, partial [bacterium]
MNEKVLLVDDDANILEGYKRSLRKKFDVETVLSGESGLKLIGENGPFAVIVSDLRMPEMDGVEFLSRVRETAPDTVRIMLTGNADLTAAMDAVNEGNIFRFLTKPCLPENLAKTLDAGMAQYRLVIAERELLEKTLSGSVKILTEILSLTSPAAFGRASRVRKIMGKLAEFLKIQNLWEFELAGMLSQTGCVTFPTEVVEKIYRGSPLNVFENRMFEGHPKVGHDLIANIPRMETVAESILFQGKKFDGSGFPRDEIRGNAIPLGGRALSLALDFDAIVWRGKSGTDALKEIKSRKSLYDPEIIQALEKMVASETKYGTKNLKIQELVSDMVLAQDVKTASGLLLVSKGQSVTPTLKERLRNFASSGEMAEEVQVLIPLTDNAGYV